MQIPIPRHFARYNEYKKAPEHGLKLDETGGMPSDCIGCGQCEGACPQHLPIISLLEQVAQAAEGAR